MRSIGMHVKNDSRLQAQVSRNIKRLKPREVSETSENNFNTIKSKNQLTGKR